MKTRIFFLAMSIGCYLAREFDQDTVPCDRDAQRAPPSILSTLTTARMGECSMGELTPSLGSCKQFKPLGRSEIVIGLIVSATALLLFDQWSKRMVQGLASEGYFSRVPFLHIRRVVELKRIYRSRHARPLMAVAWVTAAASASILTRMGFCFHGGDAEHWETCWMSFA